MTSDEIKALYAAIPLQSMDSDCVIININKTYKRHSGTDAIFLATKETWNMQDPTGVRTTALSEYHGLIVEVFKVEEWYKKERQYGPNSKKAGQTYDGFGFNSRIADEEIRQRYIYKSITHLKKKGAANVIRYSLNTQ